MAEANILSISNTVETNGSKMARFGEYHFNHDWFDGDGEFIDRWYRWV